LTQADRQEHSRLNDENPLISESRTQDDPTSIVKWQIYLREFSTMGSRKPLYRPLSPTEFRVIHILPGAFNDPIRCVLETRPASIKTRYEALSYQWGDETITKPILVAPLNSPPKTNPPTSTRCRPPSFMNKPITTIRAAIQRYEKPLYLLSHAIGTFLVYKLSLGLPVDPPTWVPAFISREAYLFLLALLCGQGPLSVLRMSSPPESELSGNLNAPSLEQRIHFVNGKTDIVHG
jgi:hypothetical protein